LSNRPPPDRPRLAAYELLRLVAAEDAYANLTLPRLIAEAGLTGRDAAFATELGYGTLRASGTLDEIVSRCVDRALADVEPGVLDLLRLGSYQLLRTRVPAHAAVASTVDLARATGNGRASGFVNAILRRVGRLGWEQWTEQLAAGQSPLRRLAVRTSHPEWIAAAFADALGGDLAETQAALEADDERPQTHLVAWPGRIDRDELVAQTGGIPGPHSPFAVRLEGGNPATIPAVRDRLAGVQDEGSQLCALALTDAQLDGRDERWLDLCAGPGGKTALLAALAAQRSARVTAVEVHPHRAELIRKHTRPWDVDVVVADARTFDGVEGGYDRVLVDAPCTGLGALRRRPEARWRRGPDDVPPLAALQSQLLAAGLRLVRPGGVVAYVTCSPHLAETKRVVEGAGTIERTQQWWPHRHGTDAMFLAILRS
jgi:16S rRNA (cytosine967-C5)-methyltransferase